MHTSYIESSVSTMLWSNGSRLCLASFGFKDFVLDLVEEPCLLNINHTIIFIINALDVECIDADACVDTDAHVDADEIIEKDTL